MCSSIEFGGLGIQRVRIFNLALLGKWLWCYGHEVNHLWHQVITSKFGED